MQSENDVIPLPLNCRMNPTEAIYSVFCTYVRIYECACAVHARMCVLIHVCVGVGLQLFSVPFDLSNLIGWSPEGGVCE